MFTNLVIANKRIKMRGADRRAAIVASATALFASRGFRGVTTKELAAAAGVSEPVLYEHFKDKSELYSAIIDAKSQAVSVLLETWFARYMDSDDDRGFFLSLAQMILDFHSKNEEYIRLTLFSALEGHQFARLSFERHAKPFYGLITRYIARRAKAGAYRPIDPPLAGRAFAALITHYCLFELQFGFKTIKHSRKSALEGLVDIYLNGILK